MGGVGGGNAVSQYHTEVRQRSLTGTGLADKETYLK
jgi:hypothetical protein